MSHFPIPYEAALQSAAYFPQSEVGVLRVSGRDRAAFLQRQTTNDLTRLSQGVLLNVLTSPTARILDVFMLLAEAESILALSSAGPSNATARFLKSRIFFMDQVTVEDVRAAFACLDLLGPQAEEMVASLAGAAPQGSEIVRFTLDGAEVCAFRNPPPVGLGFRLLAPLQVSLALHKRLEQAGVRRLDPESFEIVRIEAGLPAAPNELNQDYTPLEVNLIEAVCDSKGCYTGQEVIARQITYDKVTQRLVGLRLAAPTASGERVLYEGKPVGQVTSAGYSPRWGALALAVLRRVAIAPGTQVQVGEGTGEVTALPFGQEDENAGI